MTGSEGTPGSTPESTAPAGPPAGSGSLYGWLWRRLPGGRLARAGILLAGAVVVTLLLFAVVFPWVEPRLPFNQVTVDNGGGGG